MKKTLILIVFSVFFMLAGCKQAIPEEDTTLEHSTEKLIHKIKEDDLEILEIDGCEYIIFKETIGTNHGYGYMAHKGNCKNPVHDCHSAEISSDTLKKKNN